MKSTALALAAAAAMLLFPRPSLSQDGKAERYNVPLTDPSRPVRLRVSVMAGSITVEAHNGNSVVVEATARELEREPGDPPPPKSKEGLQRLSKTGAGLDIEEQDNTVIVRSGLPSVSVDLHIQVPVQTSVRLGTVINGDIRVTGVRGEHELSNNNGGIEAKQVAGSVVAHSINGKILVSLTSVTPDKAMAFSSLNGDVDVTVPANTKANLRMESQNGDVYTDFDVAQRPQAGNQEGRSEGRYRVKVERGVFGAINGGGPEMSFKTFNGNVHLRRAGS